MEPINCKTPNQYLFLLIKILCLEHLHVINENISSFSCWLSVDNGLIWAFAAPVIIVLVINTAMFIQALLIARKSLHKRSDSSKRDKTSTSSNWTLFKGNQKTFQIILCQANHIHIHKICSNAVIILINPFL